jgi:DNA-binding CsgD family transcriptional regulator
MSTTVLHGTDLSYHLADLPDRDAYLAAAAVCLQRGVAGDVVVWNAIDVAAQKTETWWDPPEAKISDETAATVMGEHPLVRGYLSHPNDLAPLRISDCVSELQWRNSGVYQELFVPTGARHQLAIVITPPTAMAGRAWAINRSGPDFTDRDITVAGSLQPMLALLDRTYDWVGPLGDDGAEAREEARQRAGLTVRELDVLQLVAQGLSGQQMASMRRISLRTVRKHLEHIYTKLDSHDRILAVNAARQRGLL